MHRKTFKSNLLCNHSEDEALKNVPFRWEQYDSLNDGSSSDEDQKNEKDQKMRAFPRLFGGFPLFKSEKKSRFRVERDDDDDDKMMEVEDGKYRLFQ